MKKEPRTPKEPRTLPDAEAWPMPVFFAGQNIYSKSHHYNLPPDERVPVRLIGGRFIVRREDWREYLRSRPIHRFTPKRQVAA